MHELILIKVLRVFSSRYISMILAFILAGGALLLKTNCTHHVPLRWTLFVWIEFIFRLRRWHLSWVIHRCGCCEICSKNRTTIRHGFVFAFLSVSLSFSTYLMRPIIHLFFVHLVIDINKRFHKARATFFRLLFFIDKGWFMCIFGHSRTLLLTNNGKFILNGLRMAVPLHFLNWASLGGDTLLYLLNRMLNVNRFGLFLNFTWSNLDLFLRLFLII